MDTPAPVFDPNLVAAWAEALVFGIYTALFAYTFMIPSNRPQRRQSPARVFTQVTTVLYLMSAFHVGVGLYRVIRAFIYLSPEVRAIYWFQRRWEHIVYYTSHSVMSWISQALLIYRCFLIYGSNWLIVTPSIILWCATFGVSLFCNYIWSIPGLPLLYMPVENALLPLTLVQHIGTPGLTVYRLLRQHNESRTSGIQESRSRLSLRAVGMVIMESTLLYIVVLGATEILEAMNSQNKQILISICPPTLGIAFSLITIRLHHLNNTEAHQEKTTLFTVGDRFVFTSTTELDTPNHESMNSREAEDKVVHPTIKLPPSTVP
ncbi:hypothetical protein BDN72DRAFT_111289 [Pluteus cervinus]|uniref:Uncharacterized protein n=1 Tax=Pluteus cervinus TaxID=181527 RepID=A0ACD3AMM9_9AGAR|nr:hypothetical protein BDN72DRAFT_111289 [Pluteus cervinus]